MVAATAGARRLHARQPDTRAARLGGCLAAIAAGGCPTPTPCCSRRPASLRASASPLRPRKTSARVLVLCMQGRLDDAEQCGWLLEMSLLRWIRMQRVE